MTSNTHGVACDTETSIEVRDDEAWDLYHQMGQTAGEINDMLPPHQYTNGMILLPKDGVEDLISLTTWPDGSRYAALTGMEINMCLRAVMEGYVLMVTIDGQAPGRYVYQRYLEGSFWGQYGPMTQLFGHNTISIYTLSANKSYYQDICAYLQHLHDHLKQVDFLYEPENL